MIHNKNYLFNTRDYHINIHFADGENAKRELIGKYVGYINNYKITLNDVLYVPSFKRSLLSIDHLSKEDYKMLFYKNKIKNKNCAMIYNNKGKRVYTSYSNNLNVYRVLTSKRYINCICNDVVCYNLENAFNDSDMDLWHRRLGHYNIDLIKDKLKKLKVNTGCKNFIIWYNQIRNLFSEFNIKYIKTDYGTEFFNSSFNNFYESTGIVHLHTVRHNPPQNGRVERY
eukprot:jgi/Orpsp1_1/1174572/evm.model.c7180000050617.1